MQDQQAPAISVDPTREITLIMTNAAAVFLHQMLGSQPVQLVAGAGQDGLFRELGQQIQAQNAPQG